MNPLKLTIQSNNATVIHVRDAVRVLFSYETPVAAYIEGAGYVKTDTKYSATTTRHIAQFGAKEGRPMPQEFFNLLLVCGYDPKWVGGSDSIAAKEAAKLPGTKLVGDGEPCEGRR